MAKIIVTNHGQKYREMKIDTEPIEKVGPEFEITKEYAQTMLGFGAALTESSCMMLNLLPEEKRSELLHEVFSPEKMNFSVGRVCVGASDYADETYHYAQVKDDFQMQHFDASREEKDIIPIVEMARKENPQLFLFSSPWSPPGWMKNSKIMQGGFMKDEYIDAYINYYIKFLEFYRDHGIAINALTTQNESETDQVSRMPACYWHPDTESKFVIKMREALDRHDFKDLKIWLMDHNFDMWRRPFYQLEDPEVRKAVSGIAWHPYGGYPESASWISSEYPEMEHHWTEGNLAAFLHGGFQATQKKAGYGDLAKSFLTGINNGIRSITVWNLALDEEGAPTVGPFDCKGTIEIDRITHAIHRTVEYFTLGHFSKYVKPGAKRLVLNRHFVSNNLDAAAFENPDHRVVVIVSNTAEYDVPLSFSFQGNHYYVWLKRDSVNTVIF